jgi:hypothetical protein
MLAQADRSQRSLAWTRALVPCFWLWQPRRKFLVRVLRDTPISLACVSGTPMASGVVRSEHELQATNPEGLKLWLDIHHNSQKKGAPAQSQLRFAARQSSKTRDITTDIHHD